jgi:O-antigen/teichoic acid export membrane protein
MSSAVNAIASSRLARRAFSLGAVKAFDHALQFLLPMVLVRHLDAATFGEYRLIWLTVGTLMAFATLNMSGSLYYFLPRAQPAHKRLYVQNTIAYLACAGLVLAFAVSPWNPLLPAALAPLEAYSPLVSAFVGLWIVAFLLDSLPTVEERIGWQAFATLGVAGLRATLVAAGAWLTGELRVVLWLLLAVVGVKLALLAAYVVRHHGLRRPWLDGPAFVEQFRHAAPFGLSNALFALRAQADQWVAASLFALSSFAAFSIAALVGQIVQVFRHSAMGAFLPAMSQLSGRGDVRGMLELNRRANVMVGMTLFPMLAVVFAFADELVSVLYTRAYLEAAPAMRVYVLGMVVMVIEIGSVVLLLRQGLFALRITSAALFLSVAASWSGAQAFGLAGAALGSVLAIYFDRAILLRRVSRLTGVPLGELQDWRALTRLLLTAAIAALAAWLAAPEEGPFLRLVAGTLLTGALYALMNARRLLALLRSTAPQAP